MKILNKKLSLKEFENYVKAKDFGSLPPTFLVLHHTWKPTKAQWQGKRTIDGLKRFYEGKGWSAGPHLFIAEDGIWLFTDMYDVGIHAGAGNGTLKTGYSIGIEVVGNYDSKVWSGETHKNTVGAIKILKEVLKIPNKEIKFHRDYSSKSCPGWAITKTWVYKQLTKTSMKKKNQEFYDSKHKGQGWTTMEDWVDGARHYREEREEAIKEVDDLKDELEEADEIIEILTDQREDAIKTADKLTGQYRKLVKDQNKINKTHDLELSRTKTKLTTEYNQKLSDLEEKLVVCNKLKKGAMELAEDTDFKETFKRQEEIITDLTTEVNGLDIQIAKLKSSENIIKNALRIISNYLKKWIK